MSDIDSSDSDSEYKESHYHDDDSDIQRRKPQKRKDRDSLQGSLSSGDYEWQEAEEEEEEVEEYVEVARTQEEEEAGEEEEDKVKEARVMFLEEPVVLGEESDEGGEPDRDAIRERRKTMYELDSYAALALVAQDIAEGDEDEEEGSEVEGQHKKRYSETLGIPGVVRIDLSPLSQKIVGCVPDENVTTEYPWIYVKKEIIEDNIDLHSESSDFLPVKDEIESYTEHRMLVGYAPTANEDEGQFYICLTKDSRDAVGRRIELHRREQEAKVYKSVCKESEPENWKHRGSAEVVDDMTVKRSRPLFEIEVESTADQLNAPVYLTDRAVADQRDGYVEVVPYRESFENVSRQLVDREVKVVPSIKENEAQTPIENLVSSWCQCQLDQEPMREPKPVDKAQRKLLEAFLKTRSSEICKQIKRNATWDVYANDYAKLAEEVDSSGGGGAGKPELRSRTRAYTERWSLFDGRLCGPRVINDLSWHPLWTGLAAAVYTPASKCENLLGPKAKEEAYLDDNQILVWSFDDCLRPKLILQSKRRVTSVSFCPYNGNLVIGGCTNGQIVIWDITGKIEEVERVVVKTAAQARHETVMKSLSGWMKATRGSWILRPTATSSLQQSQKGAITGIDWLSPWHKLNDRGILQDLPDDAPEEELSMQFIASSEDGSIAFWDLKWRPPEDPKAEAKKRKRDAQKPDSLIQSISSYKVLDNIFKPLYMLVCQYPTDSRNAVITSMSLRGPRMRKERIEPSPNPNDIAARKCYTMVMEKDEKLEIPAGIFVGTAKGECGLVSWEGFEFSTGISLNSEMVKWTWRKQVHDGPISHAVRSRQLTDCLLTVGGRVFAVWREDYDHPVFWRKSEYRYTACCWDSSKTSVIILGRNDGTVEVWDIFVKSHEPLVTQSLSGRVITGIYAHELPLNPRCIGFCDYNGAFRIFVAPDSEVEGDGGQENAGDADWMRQFVDREVDRIKEFHEWQRQWIEKNQQEEEDAKTMRDETRSQAEARKDELAVETEKKEEAKKAKARYRKRLVDEMRARWVTRELNRMQRAILAQKGLREEELERRIEPVLKMRKEAAEKEAKRREVMKHSDELFEEAVATSFPQQRQKFLSLTSGSQERTTELSYESVPIGDVKSEEDGIIESFEDLKSEAMLSMRRRPTEPHFDWRELVKQGLKRRRSLDIFLKNHTIKVKPEDKTTTPTISSHGSSHEDAEAASSATSAIDVTLFV